jgi:hypothetical protein
MRSALTYLAAGFAAVPGGHALPKDGAVVQLDSKHGCVGLCGHARECSSHHQAVTLPCVARASNPRGL